MLKNIINGLLFMGLFFDTNGFAAREIAITIDDLPFVGANNKNANYIKRSNDRIMRIIQALTERNIPATGFIIGGAIAKEQKPMLDLFKEKGFQLGNHTYTHKSLNNLSAEKYIADVGKADQILTPLMTTPKYFRYPYLAEGRGEKKQQVYAWLAEHKYTIAPVTIDSKDYKFNAQLLAISWRNRDKNLGQIRARYLAYIWNQTLKAEAKSNKQILLIHANLLNSHFLGDVIDMYQKNGYRFISLQEAMAAKPHAQAKDLSEAAGS